jgi:hypothetical protein
MQPVDNESAIHVHNILHLAGGEQPIFDEIGEHFKPGSPPWYDKCYEVIRDRAILTGVSVLQQELHNNNSTFELFNGKLDEQKSESQKHDWLVQFWENQAAFWMRHMDIVLKIEKIEVLDWLREFFGHNDIYADLRNMAIDEKVQLNLCKDAATQIITTILEMRNTRAKALSMIGVVPPPDANWPKPRTDYSDHEVGEFMIPPMTDEQPAIKRKPGRPKGYSPTKTPKEPKEPNEKQQRKKRGEDYVGPNAISLSGETMFSILKVTGAEPVELCIPLDISRARAKTLCIQGIVLSPAQVEALVAWLRERHTKIASHIEELEKEAWAIALKTGRMG